MFWQKRQVFFTANDVYAKAFTTLARGLWLTLGGAVAALIALGIFVLPLALKAGRVDVNAKQFLVIAGVFAVIAIVLNLWGKWTCFELQQPLELGQRFPGSRYLQTAFWCEMLSFILKTSARTLGVAQLKFLNLPLAIISQVAFLLFLRKMADVIDRPNLKRQIDALLVTIGGSGAAFGAAFALKQQGNPGASLIAICFCLACFVAALIGYMAVLAQMALAVGSFSKYLREGDDLDEDYDDKDYDAAGLADEPAS